MYWISFLLPLYGYKSSFNKKLHKRTHVEYIMQSITFIVQIQNEQHEIGYVCPHFIYNYKMS
jgi:hypothetical protein